jgi:hypothetical protein
LSIKFKSDTTLRKVRLSQWRGLWSFQRRLEDILSLQDLKILYKLVFNFMILNPHLRLYIKGWGKGYLSKGIRGTLTGSTLVLLKILIIIRCISVNLVVYITLH